jgi:uroporphyrinogen decarboxylase
MTRRENMIRILKRDGGDHVPFALGLTPRLHREFRERRGTADVAEFYGFDHRSVGLMPTRAPVDTKKYYEGRELKEGTCFDGHGVAHEPGSFEHFTHKVSPLAGRDTSLDTIKQYPLADRDAPYRFEGLEDRVRSVHERGLAVSCMVGHIFETAWQIRGMDDMLMDFLDAPEKAHELLERITRVNVVTAERFARAGADIIHVGDDVGTQHGMMFSPDTWRTFLKPRLAREIEAAKRANPDVLVWYHSDGNVEAIVPDLIEIGLDILNPVQPECIDPVEAKRRWGDRLSFWGTIGTQTTMPFGTPEDVRRAVRRMVFEVGYDGGLVLAPTHVLEPDVPWANIDAFVEACREYGRIGASV